MNYYNNCPFTNGYNGVIKAHEIINDILLFAKQDLLDKLHYEVNKKNKSSFYKMIMLNFINIINQSKPIITDKKRFLPVNSIISLDSSLANIKIHYLINELKYIVIDDLSMNLMSRNHSYTKELKKYISLLLNNCTVEFSLLVN